MQVRGRRSTIWSKWAVCSSEQLSHCCNSNSFKESLQKVLDTKWAIQPLCKKVEHQQEMAGGTGVCCNGRGMLYNPVARFINSFTKVVPKRKCHLFMQVVETDPALKGDWFQMWTKALWRELQIVCMTINANSAVRLWQRCCCVPNWSVGLICVTVESIWQIHFSGQHTSLGLTGASNQKWLSHSQKKGQAIHIFNGNVSFSQYWCMLILFCHKILTVVLALKPGQMTHLRSTFGWSCWILLLKKQIGCVQ